MPLASINETGIGPFSDRQVQFSPQNNQAYPDYSVETFDKISLQLLFSLTLIIFERKATK